MRIWFIDAWRGVAVAAMVLFHFCYDLQEFYGFSLDYRQGFLFWLGRAAAVSFICIAGLSTCLSRRSLRHGLQLLAWGGAISIGTAVLLPDQFIRFGILHFLGCALLTAPLLHRLPPTMQFAFFIISLWIGLYPDWDRYAGPTFLAGLLPIPIASADYYPFFPWYALFIAGHLGGAILLHHLQPTPPPAKWRLLSWIGRHSLEIYLLHQPVLLLPYWLFS